MRASWTLAVAVALGTGAALAACGSSGAVSHGQGGAGQGGAGHGGAGTSSSLQQSTDTAEQAGVTAGGGRTGGVFPFDGFLHAALVAS